MFRRTTKRDIRNLQREVTELRIAMKASGHPIGLEVVDGARMLRCSFCGKSQKDVKKLVAGAYVYICDECVDLCNEIIAEDAAQSAVENPPAPEQPIRDGQL